MYRPTRWIIPLIALTAMVGTALAGGIEFKNDPTFKDNGVTLTARGQLEGLGDEDDVTTKLRAAGMASGIECTNPAGKVVPKKGERRVTTTGSETIDAEDLANNGRHSFEVTTDDPELKARALGCPGNKWEVEVDDIDFTSATVKVTQGDMVLTETFDL